MRAGSCFVMSHTASRKDTNIPKDSGPVEPLDIKIQISEKACLCWLLFMDYTFFTNSLLIGVRFYLNPINFQFISDLISINLNFTITHL